MSEDSSYTSQDDNLLDAISTTSELFERICGREFLKKERTEYYDSVANYKETYNVYPTDATISYSDTVVSSGEPYQIQLKCWPIDPLAQFKIYYDPSRTYTTELPIDNYTIDEETGILTINCATYAAKKGIKVVYTAGYTDSVDIGVTENINDPTQERSLGLNIPTDLKQAVLHQAAFYAAYIQASLCSSDNKPSLYVSNNSFMNAYKLTPTAMLLLDKYKRKYIKFI
jgi:hypothetical protein